MGNATPTGMDDAPWLVIFPFLQQVSPEDQHYFLQRHIRRLPDETETGSRYFEHDTLLFSQDTPVSHLYVVIEGVVEEFARPPTNREPYPLQRHVVGNVSNSGNTSRILIGIYDLFYHGRYSTSAYARAATALYQIDGSGIDWLLARMPALSEQLAPFHLLERLRTLPLLAGLTPVALGFLADEFNRRPHRYYAAGETIYEANSHATTLYFIDRGQVYLEWPDDRNRWLGNGGTFGLLEIENALPGNEILTHRAVAAKEVSILRLPRLVFRRITGLNPDTRGQEAYDILARAVDEVPLFAGLQATEQHQLLGYFSHYYLPDPHILIQQGEMNDSLWLLLPNSRAQVHALKAGGDAYQSVGVEGPAYFGEAALHAESPMGATVEGEEGSQWVRLHRHDLEEAGRDLGQNIKARLPRPNIILDTEPYSPFPTYQWLQSGEAIHLLCHRHGIDLLRKVLPSIVILLSLLTLSLGVAGGLLAPAGWVYATIIGGGLVMMVQVAWALIDYLNDFLIITNRRLVLQEEVLFFRRWRRETPLERIQNIDIRIDFWGKVFGYGNIVVRTAAEQGALPFAFVTNPKMIEQTVTTLRTLRKTDEEAKKRSSVQHLLTGRLRLRLQLPAQVCLPTATTTPADSWWRRLRRWVKELLLWHSGQPADSQHMVWRKHWLILLGRLSPALGLPLAIVLFLAWQLLGGAVVSRWLLGVDILLFLLSIGNLLWAFWIVADWRNDTYEVNATSIIDVEKKPLFFDEIRRSARLDEIENIEVKVPSLFHYLFDFGNVRLQTASSNGDFTFDRVPHPHAVAAEVQRRIQEYQIRERDAAAHRRAQELPDWFDLYDLLGGVRKRRARPPLA